MSILFTFLRWFLQKFAGIALIVALTLTAYGLWLLVHDQVDVDVQRAESVRGLRAKYAGLLRTGRDLERRIAHARAEMAMQQDRQRRAEVVLQKLSEVENGSYSWLPFTTDSAQVKTNAERAERMRATSRDAAKQTADLRLKFTQLTREKEGIDLEAANVADECSSVEDSRSLMVHYGRRAWQEGKWYAVLATGVCLLSRAWWRSRRERRRHRLAQPAQHSA